MAAAAKVGGLVVLFGLLLVGAYAVLQRSVFAPPAERYFVVFQDAGGLTTGSAVLLAGVKVGSVTEVSLVSAGSARATISVDRGVQIPKGSLALLPTSFISIGDMRLQLVPPARPGGDFHRPGDTIPGRLGSPLEAFAPNSAVTLDELNKTLVAFRELLEDQELKGGLKELMATLNVTTKQYGQLAGRVDGLIAKNQGQVEALLVTASASLKDLRAVAVEVRKLAESGELQGKATALLDNLNTAVTQGTKLVEDLRAMANDPKMRGAIDETLANVKVMSESGTKIAADAEIMARNGVAISEEAKTLMGKANALADQVDELIRKFNRTVDDLTKGGKTLGQGIQAEATMTAESKPGRLRVDVNAIVPIGKERLSVGLWDAFESNRINAQLIREVRSGLDLRYGAYAGKPGLGVDYALAPRAGVRADVFGLNDPRFDLRFRYDFGKGVSGWAGMERIFERNAPSVGVSVRR